MTLRTNFFCILVLFVFLKLVFAGELLVPQAVEYYNEGVKAQKAHDYETADIKYNKCVLLDPNNLDWQKFIANNHGIMYYHEGDMEKAEAYFNEALKIDPNYQTPKLNLGFIYEKKRTELESLKYWMNMYNITVESYKPKGVILEEERLGANK